MNKKNTRNWRPVAVVAAVVGGIAAISLLTGTGTRNSDQVPSEVSPAVTETIRRDFATSCKESGGGDTFCTCTANNLASSITTQAKLDEFLAINQLEGDEAISQNDAYMQPHTVGCV